MRFNTDNMKEAIVKPEITFFISIISPIIAVSVTIATLGSRVELTENRLDYFESAESMHVKEIDTRFRELDGTFTLIKIQLAEIQKDILYIKDKVK